MIALAHSEQENNALGIPHTVALDPANQFRFVTRPPVTDWALHTLAADQAAYYKRYDTDPKNPMNRAGHQWSVYLKPAEGEPSL